VLKDAKSRIELLLKHSSVDSTKLDSITTSTSLDAVKDVEFLFDAIPEDLEAKKSLMKILEKIVSKDTHVITCTSSLLVSDVFKDSIFQNHARMNFEYPIFKYPYVEVTASDEMYVKIQKLCKEFKKIPYRVKEAIGGVSPRLLTVVLSEILEMIHSGYKIADIQQSIGTYGLSIRTLDLLDAIGIDQFHNVVENLVGQFPNRFAQNPFVTDLYKEKSFGRKSAIGFSLYLDGGRKDIGLNDTFRDELAKIKKKTGNDILERILFRLLNESMFILEERLVEDPYIIDVITSSLGITAFQEGGIFALFQNWKPIDILDRLKKLEGLYGSRFSPPQLLKDRVKFDRLLTNDKVTGESSKVLLTPFNWDLFPKARNHAWVFWKWGAVAILIVGFFLVRVFSGRTKK
jgi:3-hydroxyacyl-CoA dehydrogenase